MRLSFSICARPSSSFNIISFVRPTTNTATHLGTLAAVVSAHFSSFSPCLCCFCDRRSNDHFLVHVYLDVDDVCIFGLINNTIITTFIVLWRRYNPETSPPSHSEDTSTSLECVVVVVAVNDAAALQRVYIIIINRYIYSILGILI